MEAAERAERPSSVNLTNRSISSRSVSSTKLASASGQLARWTEGGASGVTFRIRFRYIASVTNGIIGAHSLQMAVSVTYAARLSVSFSLFQKRRRLRRTYQFDKSLMMKSPIAREASVTL